MAPWRLAPNPAPSRKSLNYVQVHLFDFAGFASGLSFLTSAAYAGVNVQKCGVKIGQNEGADKDLQWERSRWRCEKCRPDMQRNDSYGTGYLRKTDPVFTISPTNATCQPGFSSSG